MPQNHECVPAQSASDAAAPSSDGSKVLGNRNYSDLLTQIRGAFRSNHWATDAEKQQIGYTEKVVNEHGYRKEISFSIPEMPLSPEFSTLYFKQDGYGNLSNGKWDYQTACHSQTRCGRTDLVKISSAEWDVSVERRDGRDHYTLRTRQSFVGGVKLSINGTSYMVYTHGDDSQKPEIPPAAQSAPSPSALSLPDRPNSSDPVVPKVPKLSVVPPPKQQDRGTPTPPETQSKRDDDIAKREQAVRDREEKAQKQEAANRNELQRVAALDQQLQKQKANQDLRQQQLDQSQKQLGSLSDQLQARRDEQERRKKELDDSEGQLNARAKTQQDRQAALDKTGQQLDSLAAQLTSQKREQDDTKKGLETQSKKLGDLGADLKAQQAAAGEDKRDLAAQQKAAREQADAEQKRQRELEGLGKDLETQSKTLAEREKALAAAEKDLAKRKQNFDSESSVDGAARKQQGEQLERDAAGLKKERETLAEQRAGANKLQQQLEQERDGQRTAKAALDSEQRALAKREQESTARQKELDEREKMLKSLAGEVEARSAALKAKEDAREKTRASGQPLTVGSAPARPPINKPDFKWEVGPSASRAEVTPVRLPDIDLPSWMQLATALNFDRESFEQSFAPSSYEDMLAGGDQGKRQLLETQAQLATGEARAAGERNREWFDANINQAYKPIMGAYVSLQDTMVQLARLHALDKDAKIGDWSDETRKEVKEQIEYASKCFRIAAAGSGSKDPSAPNEERIGATAKTEEIQKRIEELNARGDKRTPDENQLLDFYRSRKARMEDFAALLVRMEPYAKRLEKAGEALERFDTLKEALPEAGPKSDSQPELESGLRSALESPFQDESRAPDLTAITTELGKLARVSAADRSQIKKQLGAEADIETVRSNLKQLQIAADDPKLVERLAHAQKTETWNTIAGILATDKPTAQKNAAIIAAYSRCLKSQPSADELFQLTEGLEKLHTLQVEEQRTAALQLMLKPLSLLADAAAKEQLADLRKNISGADANLAACGKALGYQKLAAETDNQYLAFAGSIPRYADSQTAQQYDNLQPEQRTPIDAEIEKRRAAAVEALKKEQAALKEFEGQQESAQNAYELMRLRRINYRLKSIERWAENRR